MDLQLKTLENGQIEFKSIKNIQIDLDKLKNNLYELDDLLKKMKNIWVLMRTKSYILKKVNMDIMLHTDNNKANNVLKNQYKILRIMK